MIASSAAKSHVGTPIVARSHWLNSHSESAPMSLVLLVVIPVVLVVLAALLQRSQRSREGVVVLEPRVRNPPMEPPLRGPLGPAGGGTLIAASDAVETSKEASQEKTKTPIATVMDDLLNVLLLYETVVIVLAIALVQNTAPIADDFQIAASIGLLGYGVLRGITRCLELVGKGWEKVPAGVYALIAPGLALLTPYAIYTLVRLGRGETTLLRLF